MSLVLVRFGRAARALRRRLGLRYGVSVLLLGAVLLSSFLALASAEAQLREGGHRVDVAGRQRMLTQQIALQSLLAVRPGPPVDREEARGALRAALGRMRAEHDLLRTGSARLGLSAASAHARRRYAGPDGLDAQLASFWSQAAVVAEDGPAASDGGSSTAAM